MGEHKHNPTAIAAKKGELPAKEKKHMSKRKWKALMRKKIQDATGLPELVHAMGGDYFYV